MTWNSPLTMQTDVNNVFQDKQGCAQFLLFRSRDVTLSLKGVGMCFAFFLHNLGEIGVL